MKPKLVGLMLEAAVRKRKGVLLEEHDGLLKNGSRGTVGFLVSQHYWAEMIELGDRVMGERLK